MYLPIIFLTLSALVAIANQCVFIETWLRRRRGIRFRYASIPFASLACGCVVWIRARGTFGFWAFVPALLDPGTWAILPLAWKWWAERSAAARKPQWKKPKDTWKQHEPPPD
jgi:hypothetical protein